MLVEVEVEVVLLLMLVGFWLVTWFVTWLVVSLPEVPMLLALGADGAALCAALMFVDGFTWLMLADAVDDDNPTEPDVGCKLDAVDDMRLFI